jgi:hypothetical protein
MRSHLCQILAHYVLFLGSQLKLPIPTDAEQFILKTTPSRWNKEGLFRWKNRLEDEAGFYAEYWIAEEFHRAHSSGNCATVRLDSNVPHPLQSSLPFDSDIWDNPALMHLRMEDRHVMMATVVGVVIAIFLGLASLAVGGYQAWVSYQQWQHPVTTGPGS